MKYTNATIRRQNRLLDKPSATVLLDKGEYGIMSMYCDESGSYGIPLNYVWDGEKSIYIHCATEGRKLQCLDKHQQVSFCVVGRTNVIAEKFTTEYESIVLRCYASRGLAKEERMKALELILGKYSPQDMQEGMRYAEKSFGRTEIIRLDIAEWSGKQKRM